MSEKVRFQKKVYNKNQFSKVVDSEFRTFVTAQQQEEQITVQDFFNLYDRLYLQIPDRGTINSHEFLIRRSRERVTLDIDVQPLLDEIADLRERLLEANQQIIELETTSALNGLSEV